MARRLVICCDGTWNSPDATDDGVPTPTHVARLAEKVASTGADGTPQTVYYDPGVGSQGSKLRRLWEGATGSGLSANVRQAYAFLVQHYAPGDELFLFGFSRGAFTVRSLSGLIRNSGILQRSFADQLPQAWDLYRDGSRASHPREREATLFRRTYAVEDISPIHFIGVWDTVGALGNPLLLNGTLNKAQEFHDTDLSSYVRHACQALAVDEERRHFQATLWNQPAPNPNQTLEQRWFVGVHSDCGGGYKETGLSDIAFDWMLGKARACGLAHEPIALRPDWSQPVHRSRKGFYKVFPASPRKIGEPTAKGATNECLDPTVLQRWKEDPGYRPKALQAYFQRHPDKVPR